MRIFPVVLALPLGSLLLQGCLWGWTPGGCDTADTGNCDTGDSSYTTITTSRPTLQAWSYLCDNGTPDVTTYDAEVDEFSERATVLIAETGAPVPYWVEQHEMAGDGFDFEIELDATTNSDAVVAQETTLFTCALIPSLTVVWRIYDGEGLADCVVVGHDPWSVIDGLEDYYNSYEAPPSGLEQISEATCRVDDSTNAYCL